jgi:hypothetical protein
LTSIDQIQTKDSQLVNKLELLDKLWIGDNELALEAVKEMQIHGWLCNGSLEGIALCQANLQGADLTKANLSNVDLHQAHLENTDLRMTNLRGAKLVRVRLNNADLAHADLSGTDLYKADLSEAQNLTDEQLSKVHRLWGAIMPDGNTYDGRYNLEGDLALARLMSVDTDDPKKMAEFYGIPLVTYLFGQQLIITDKQLVSSGNVDKN